MTNERKHSNAQKIFPADASNTSDITSMSSLSSPGSPDSAHPSTDQQPQATDAASDSDTDSWTKADNPHQAWMTIIGTVAVTLIIILCLGFFVSWGLAAIAAIIMIPGGIALAVLAKHPESTGGRSMLGISNPSTLLDPFRGKSTSDADTPAEASEETPSTR
jgi:ABC-type multidrug transport system fused ATPase/permease subunit